MCIAVCYPFNNFINIVNFAQKGARLPVHRKDGQLVTLPWGCREGEASHLPFGGWIHQNDIAEQTYAKYFPKLIKLPVVKFQEIDFENQALWFDVVHGKYIQGVLLRDNQEYRLYVMVMTPANHPRIKHHRWPVIVCDNT